ncbi:protein kinase domain-containing protein [Archangium gephyra]|uniref:protein kinase domain-containing protein n=1 Tax=Archangium gephyra TaxID=48 RepID=UPI003B7795C3
MGEVWLAVRTGRAGFHRLVVLKRMLDEDSEDPAVQLHRFIGEARTAARLHHPNIVSVYDLGQIEGGWFIVMEYLSGVNVLELVRRVEKGSRLPLEVIVEISQQALRGLAYAHERGVIHRDISADNLVVSFDGVVKVVDFGIAHGTGEAQERVSANVSAPSENRLTQAGGIIGKMAYMPPERLQGAEATASGDLYALGCVIYELLFGDLPDSSLDGLPLPHMERPDAPAAYQQLRNVLDIALHLDPQRRFVDARAFLLALEPVRHALPAVELSSWLRENFAERWTRERELSEARRSHARRSGSAAHARVGRGARSGFRGNAAAGPESRATRRGADHANHRASPLKPACPPDPKEYAMAAKASPAKKSTKRGASAPESVETFLASLEHPFKQEILALRQIILGADPRIAEGIKWNAPSFHTSEYFATFQLRAKDGVQVILHLGAKTRDTAATGIAIADPDALLEWLAKDRASVKFRDLKDIAAKRSAFAKVLREWLAYV